MKKWLVMAVLCLSMAGCGWFKGDSADADADADAGAEAEETATEKSTEAGES